MVNMGRIKNKLKKEVDDLQHIVVVQSIMIFAMCDKMGIDYLELLENFNDYETMYEQKLDRKIKMNSKLDIQPKLKNDEYLKSYN